MTREPETKQPNTFADQLRISFRHVKSVGFKFDSETGTKIEKIIAELDSFGLELREVVRQNGFRFGDYYGVRKTRSRFIERGRAIVQMIEDISEEVEEALKIK